MHTTPYHESRARNRSTASTSGRTVSPCFSSRRWRRKDTARRANTGRPRYESRLLQQRRQLAANAAVPAPPMLQRLRQANRFCELWRLRMDCEQAVVGIDRNKRSAGAQQAQGALELRLRSGHMLEHEPSVREVEAGRFEPVAGQASQMNPSARARHEFPLGQSSTGGIRFQPHHRGVRA